MAWTASTWSDFLARELAYPVEVVYGRATRDVIVARYVGDRGERSERLQVRMNAGFADAPG